MGALSLQCGGGDDNDAEGNGGSGGGGSSSKAGSTSKSGAPSFGGAVTVVPGAPNCGLDDAAAFCDQFDAAADSNGRAGELDSTLWSGTRAQPQLPTRGGLAIAITAATLPACRPDQPAQVFPNQDFLICDPIAAIPSPHLLVASAAQNYGQNSLRIRQPFDFEGRTGKVVFDAEGYVKNALLGWVSLTVSEDPMSAPGFSMGGEGVNNDEGTQIPRNGFSIHLQSDCAGYHEPPIVGVRMIIVFNDYVPTVYQPEGSPVCPKTQQGHLNHFEVSVSQSRIEIHGSDFSEADGAFGETTLVFGADVELPMTRGYVTVSTHNHATLKYSDGGTLDAWVARWDNVGFDGPKLTGTREYEVPDSLDAAEDPDAPGVEKVNIGYLVADAADGPAQTLTFSGVDRAGMARAQLALSCWYLDQEDPTTYGLQYRFNGGAWHDRPLSAAEAGILTSRKSLGQLAQVMDVPLEDLVEGDNTLEIVATNVPQNYPPVVSNIDLVLSE